MCQIELSDRRISFATSLIGCKSISLSRRCCSGSVHTRYARLDLTPKRRTNLLHAHLGLPDSSTSFVNKALNSFPLTFIFARTRSRAAFDQRNSRRDFPSCMSPMVLDSPEL